jgi:hypothetical protein
MIDSFIDMITFLYGKDQSIRIETPKADRLDVSQNYG